MNRTYRVMDSLDHDGWHYVPGESVELSDAEAAPLVARDVVALRDVLTPEEIKPASPEGDGDAGDAHPESALVSTEPDAEPAPSTRKRK